MNLNAYQATFYDGLSSKPHKASAAFETIEIGVRLSYDEQVLVWSYSDLTVEGSASSFIIRNKRHPSQSLFLSDSEAFERLKNLRKQVGSYTVYERILHSSPWVKWATFLGIVALAILAYFSWVPTLASNAVRVMPLSIDKEIGDIFYQNAIEPTIKVDSAATVLLTDLAAHLPYKGKMPVTILVDNNSQVNAYALPNGTIIVNTGIISKTKTPSELLAVVGHEMTHISERHSVRMMTKNLTNILLISLLFSDVNSMAQVLVDNAQQLQSLSYSRQYEEDADKGSFELLRQARISPQGLADLFITLEKETKSASVIPEFLQTHPLSTNRVKAANKLIKQNPYIANSNASKLEERFRELKKTVEK